MTPSKISLVTGAASGIGLECAQTLARRGDRVLLLDRSEEVNAVAAGMRAQGLQAESFMADLANLEQIEAVTAAILKATGGVDILVNNAGIHPKVNGRVPSFEEITAADWELVFRINTTAPFLLTQRLVGPMKERKWGRIVNIASRAARAYSERAGTHYSASKAAVIGMTRKIAGDYAAYGITANCVAPGQIMTPLAQRSSPEVLATALKKIPAQRFGESSEVAGAVAYFSSDIAGFSTGMVMDLNGGETML
jgi:3-oxoacyl-[acyl-carrier protein] reductase